MEASQFPNSDGADAKSAVRPLIAVSIIYIILNTLFVSLRFISRRFIKRTKLGWDDWLIIPGYLFNIAGCIMGLFIAHYMSIGNGPGKRPIVLPVQIKTMLEPTLRSAYVFVFFEVLGLTFPKLSLCVLYLRLFAGRGTRIFTWGIIALTVMMGVGFSLAGLFICSPVPFFWNKLLPGGGHCHNLNTYFRSFGLPNIIIDLLIIGVPLPAVWRLRMPTGKKLGLTVIFLTGVFTIIVSCIRWAIFQRLDALNISPSTTTPLIFINIIECSTYLIAACLPASYPIVSRLAPATLRARLDRLFSTTRPRTGLKNISTNDYWSDRGSGRHTKRSHSGDRNLLPLPNSYMRPYSPHGEGKASRVLAEGTEHASLDRVARRMGLEDGGELRKGNRIAVTTEIEVTQEERIDRLLGL